MRLTQHALEKCQIYGVEPADVLNGLQTGDTFMDFKRGGSLVKTFCFHDRCWVAVLKPETDLVITVYPTDQRTIDSRRSNGRWMV